MRWVIVLLALLLTACDQQPQRQKDVEVQMVVSTTTRGEVCWERFGKLAIACYVDGIIYLRESGLLPAGSYTVLIPHNVHIPHLETKDLWSRQKCGYEIAYASGFEVEPNQAESLCEEAAHAAGISH